MKTEKRKQLTMLFHRLFDLTVRDHMRTHATEGMNPNRGQGRVLAILKMQPEIGQRELGYLLDMSKQALAELLNKLEKNEYITRTQSEKDRRSFIVKLTDKGREALPQDNDEPNHNTVYEIFDCLNDEEQSNLINYMGRLIEAFSKNAGDEDDYAEFIRERFFARHGGRGHGGHKHGGGFFGGFGGFGRGGFEPRGGFGGFGDDNDDDK